MPAGVAGADKDAAPDAEHVKRCDSQDGNQRSVISEVIDWFSHKNSLSVVFIHESQQVFELLLRLLLPLHAFHHHPAELRAGAEQLGTFRIVFSELADGADER